MGRWIGLVMAMLVWGWVVAPAGAAPFTTLERTIRDCDGDNLLEFAPGEDYVTEGFEEPEPDPEDDPCPREEAERRPRLPNTQSIFNFLQLSDFQIVDEESPARVEFLDTTQRGPFNPFSAAYRPQESLTTQVTEAMVRQARDAVSPVTAEPLELTILTGDNADSQQHNETRWFIDMLDGTAGNGNPDPEMYPRRDRKLDPNSGVSRAGDPNFGDQTPFCEAEFDDDAPPDSLYDGVRGGGREGPDDGYYNPDGDDDGDGYSPDRERNLEETPGRDVTVRDFRGLFEEANKPFEGVGLDMPWYSAFGNHDALVQGNSPEAYLGPGGLLHPEGQETSNPVYQALATGCVKPTKSNAFDGLQTFIEQAEGLLADGKAPASAEVQAVVDAARIFLEGQVGAQNAVVVPPDIRRCFLAKDENEEEAPNGAPPPCLSPEATGSWIEQHFRTTGTPVGHGFDPRNRPEQARDNNDGYYSFIPREHLRFVVLDSVTDECGSEFCSEGSIDDDQFRWLDEELNNAATEGQYVLVFSHHTLRTMRQPTTDTSEQPIHYGQRLDRENPPNPQNVSIGRSLEELFCDHPNVLAHITGHEHQNYVEHYRCEEDTPPALGPGDFWEVSTAAHIDWSMQARMIELVQADEPLIEEGDSQQDQQEEAPQDQQQETPQDQQEDSPPSQEEEKQETTPSEQPAGDSAATAAQEQPQPPEPEQTTPEPPPTDTQPGQDTDEPRMWMVLTILDHAGPPDPGSGNAGHDVLRLASIGREIAYNDYQGGRFTGGRGERGDRNLIVPLNRPFPCPEKPDECSPDAETTSDQPTDGQGTGGEEATDPVEGEVDNVGEDEGGIGEAVDDAVDDVTDTVQDVAEGIGETVASVVDAASGDAADE